MKKALLSLLGGILLTATTSILANDTFPASYRAEPLSVEAHWTTFAPPEPPLFLPSVNPSTDYTFVDDSDPSTTIYTGEPFSVSGGAPFIEYDLTAMTIYVPNWIDEMPLKKARIQITYWTLGAPLSSSSLSIVSGSDNGSSLSGWTLVDYFDSPSPPVTTGQFEDPVINTAVFDIELQPNPDWELFQIDFPGAISIEQVDVDTVSVPEPSTFALLLGVLALVVIVRRRSLALGK